MTPESVYSVSHSYSNPKFGHMSAIQKSSSYPSQSSTYEPKITPSPSITQLEANKYYNRGRYSINGKDKQRSSMQSNDTRYVKRFVASATLVFFFSDDHVMIHSEPRTSTAVNNMNIINTYKYDTNNNVTPISDNESLTILYCRN